MSDRPTSTDVMNELHALRGDLRRQGADLKKLVDQKNDHERRITALEPIRDSFRDLTDCNDQIMRMLDTIRGNQDKLMAELSRKVEEGLRHDLFELRRELRTEMARLSMGQEQLTAAHDRMSKLLSERPCVATGECNQ